MARPLASPTRAPAAIPAATPAAMVVFSMTRAATHPDSAATEPTERSKPPATITNVIPMAMTDMIEDCSSRFVRLMDERNRSVSRLVTAARASSVTRGS